MKILIIGSKGFIGSAALNFYLHKNYVVFGCDIVNDYTSENYFQIDATNSEFNQIFKSYDFDVCINCSGAASVPQSLQNPLRDFTLNTYNVAKLLEAIKEYQPNCKFVNLSSAAVYGNPIELPIKESSICNPISPYGIHKKFAEELCTEYQVYFNLKTCNVRIFSAFGNGLKKQLIWDLYQKFKTQNSIELFGTGEETRDFIHVDDIISALTYVIKNGDFKGENYNIANGQEIKIKDIAKLFAKLTGSQKTIIFNQQQKEGDPIFWRADITKIKSFGYEQKISIEEGLRKYIQWANEQN